MIITFMCEQDPQLIIRIMEEYYLTVDRRKSRFMMVVPTGLRSLRLKAKLNKSLQFWTLQTK